uniref:Uncharacterized protein n=1 Tax=CrAss-like virus sp. ctYsL76 TaxID=2826826 RepID=A0A8S5QN56_9CAUD|nr:MAG TPA: hypothetical protein [CrAss-like virus sp. ctYsL76]
MFSIELLIIYDNNPLKFNNLGGLFLFIVLLGFWLLWR